MKGDKNMELQSSLPAVVVRGIVPIPQNDFRIEVGRKVSLKAVEEAEKNFSSYVLILVQKNPLIENPTTSDLETYGVLAKVAMKIKLPNDNYKIKFNILSRIKVNEYFLTDPYFVADYEEVQTKPGDLEEENTLIKMIVSETTSNPNQLLNNAQQISEQIQSGLSADRISDILAYNLKINDTEKYKYLQELQLNNRLKLILEDMNKLKMIADLEQRI